ncbi:hypothetical protein A2U01_0067602, partial [Trifolium medium]|nr:hypothetical protein [Trifolium medium]
IWAWPRLISRPELQNLELLAERGICSLSEEARCFSLEAWNCRPCLTGARWARELK